MRTSRDPVIVSLTAALILAACGDVSGSAPLAFNPCEEGPIRWTVGEIDPRFGLSEPAVREAIEGAIAVWEEPFGAPFFVYHPDGDLPINLAYDERQERAVAARRDRERLTSLHREIELLGRDYERRLSRHRRDIEAHERTAEELRGSIRRLNAEVERINRQGRRSEVDVRQVERSRARLRAAREATARREAELLRTSAEIERAHTHLSSLVREAETIAGRLEAVAGVAEQSALHEGIVTTRRGRRIAREHSITVFQFADPDHLRLILTHELGHALGLGHLDEVGAIMYPVHDPGAIRTPISAHPADLAALRVQCAPHTP